MCREGERKAKSGARVTVSKARGAAAHSPLSDATAPQAFADFAFCEVESAERLPLEAIRFVEEKSFMSLSIIALNCSKVMQLFSPPHEAIIWGDMGRYGACGPRRWLSEPIRDSRPSPCPSHYPD